MSDFTSTVQVQAVYRNGSALRVAQQPVSDGDREEMARERVGGK